MGGREAVGWEETRARRRPGRVGRGYTEGEGEETSAAPIG